MPSITVYDSLQEAPIELVIKALVNKGTKISIDFKFLTRTEIAAELARRFTSLEERVKELEYRTAPRFMD